MQNVTPMLARKDESPLDEPRSSLPGGIIGFFSYWCALAIPFQLYGSKTIFFFLALLPVSVLIGIIFSMALRGRLLWTTPATAIVVVCLFWLLFSFLSGW